jgi:hypothetical protein
VVESTKGKALSSISSTTKIETTSTTPLPSQKRQSSSERRVSEIYNSSVHLKARRPIYLKAGKKATRQKINCSLTGEKSSKLKKTV